MLIPNCQIIVFIVGIANHIILNGSPVTCLDIMTLAYAVLGIITHCFIQWQ